MVCFPRPPSASRYVPTCGRRKWMLETKSDVKSSLEIKSTPTQVTVFLMFCCCCFFGGRGGGVWRGKCLMIQHNKCSYIKPAQDKEMQSFLGFNYSISFQYLYLINLRGRKVNKLKMWLSYWKYMKIWNMVISSQPCWLIPDGTCSSASLNKVMCPLLRPSKILLIAYRKWILMNSPFLFVMECLAFS